LLTFGNAAVRNCTQPGVQAFCEARILAERLARAQVGDA
jgi:hypothetical protein